MPWTPVSFRSHWKEATETQIAAACKQANAVLKSCLKEGGPPKGFNGDCEGFAIATAIANVKKGTGLTKEELQELVEQDLIEVKLTGKQINDLPDAAFAYIRSGGKKDDTGLTAPRALRYLPHHSSGVKSRAENSSVDLPHLRNALARLPQTNLTPEEKAKAKSHLQAHSRALGVGQTTQKESIFEEFAGTDEFGHNLYFHSFGSNEDSLDVDFTFKESRIDEEAGMVRNVLCLKSESRNGYTYLTKAMAGGVSKGLFENLKVFANHPDPRNPRRDVRDTVGKIVNARFAGNEVRGDLAVLEHQRNWVFSLAKMPDLAGMSIIGKGKIYREEKSSRPAVDELLELKSCDIVTDPATTRGLFESTEESDEWKGTEEEKTLAGALVSVLKDGEIEKDDKTEQCKVLIESFAAGSNTEEDTGMTLEEVQQEVVDLKEKLATAETTIQETTDREKREKLVSEKVAEAKLPAEAISEAFKLSLLTAPEDQVDALIKDRQEVWARKAGKPKSSSTHQDILTEGDDGEAKTEEEVKTERKDLREATLQT